MAKLSARKEKILKSLVEDYIESASPVSSSEIQSKHLLDLSSATIRNELAALEEMGYLYQPHTSAGRVPTSQAYEEYVSNMMPHRKLGRDEVKRIRKHFDSRMMSMKDILKSTARIISEMTNYTSLACVNDISSATITNIKIVRLTPTTAMVIVVTDMGVLKDTVVTLDEEVNDAYCDAVSRLAMQTFGGRTIHALTRPNQLIAHTLKGYRKFFNAVLDILKQYDANAVEDVILEGTSKILEYPEYSDMQRARAMLQTLDAKQDLLSVLNRDADDEVHLRINIGSHGGDPLDDCAIVTVDYVVDGKSIGKAGVIGPLRMDYSKVVSVLDYVAKTVAENALPEREPDGEGE